tara:strand:- start:834 stop:1742 length:909 start_codon:yes stop_codon:yes gene_type:complete
MPFTMGVTSSAFKLNLNAPMGCFILSAGQNMAPSHSSGSAGDLVVSYNGIATLERGDVLNITVGAAQTTGTSPTTAQKSQIVLGKSSETLTYQTAALYGSTKVYNLDTQTTTTYGFGNTATVGIELLQGQYYVDPETGTEDTRVSATLQGNRPGAPGIGGNGNSGESVWALTGSGFPTINFPSYPDGGPGLEDFRGVVVGQGGAGVLNYSKYTSGIYGGTSYVGSPNSTRAASNYSAENTGRGGTSSVNGPNSYTTGKGAKGLVQVRYPSTYALLRDSSIAEYTLSNGYHVYTFNTSTSIEI